MLSKENLEIVDGILDSMIVAMKSKKESEREKERKTLGDKVVRLHAGNER